MATPVGWQKFTWNLRENAGFGQMDRLTSCNTAFANLFFLYCFAHKSWKWHQHQHYNPSKSDLEAWGCTVPWIVMVLPGWSPPLMVFLYGTAWTKTAQVKQSQLLLWSGRQTKCWCFAVTTLCKSVDSWNYSKRKNIFLQPWNVGLLIRFSNKQKVVSLFLIIKNFTFSKACVATHWCVIKKSQNEWQQYFHKKSQILKMTNLVKKNLPNSRVPEQNYTGHFVNPASWDIKGFAL